MKFPLRPFVFAAALLLVSCSPSYAQDNAPTGSVEVTAVPKIGTKQQGIERKRFYLLYGGLETNKTLIEKLKAANPASRDCFYCKIQASPEYIAWLKARDCESAYCREIAAEDVAKVPEFKAAYEKSLVQYGNKPAIAQKWLINNLSPNLSYGLYEERKLFLDTLLEAVKPIRSAMTDSVNFKAMFIDIPLKEGDTTETFLISNLVPIEIGQKSYTWACEVKVRSDELATVKLQIPETDKAVKNCEVIIKDLPACNAVSCAKR